MIFIFVKSLEDFVSGEGFSCKLYILVHDWSSQLILIVYFLNKKKPIHVRL